LLVWKIKRGLDIAIEPHRISDYVLYFFDQELQQHFSEEEQFLFPMLEKENEMRQRAEQEHRVIYELIRKLRVEKSAALLQQFARALKDHIRFEERELFAQLQEVTGTAELDKLPAHSSHCPDTDAGWPDSFWLV
jgi:iron-sulfur cluster repair protein YtfE (RIC family)